MVSNWKLLISSTSHVVVGGAINEGDGGSADVAAHQRWASAGGDDLARQRRGGGFAVGAGDGDDVALEEACREFHLADDGDAALAGMHQLRDIVWARPGLQR